MMYNASATQVAQTNTFSHAYQSAGTFTITFTATNVSGNTNSSTATVQVGGGGCLDWGCPPPPQANFTASPTYGQAPLQVSFSVDPSYYFSGYSVSFGDGAQGTIECWATMASSNYGGTYSAYPAPSSGCGTSHTYTSPGTYTATLARDICRNAVGCMAPVQIVGTVTITVTGGGSCDWWDWYCLQGYNQNQNYNYNYYNPYDYSNYQTYYPTYQPVYQTQGTTNYWTGWNF
jgi:PKD repeat protein